MSPKTSSKSDRFISTGAWLLAFSLAALAIYLGWRTRLATAQAPAHAPKIALAQEAPPPTQAVALEGISLPALKIDEELFAIPRKVSPHTIIPNRPADDAREYIVTTGDSVFEIATRFNIEPETLLWANYEQLNDNPDMISIGMKLKIPPVDGVYYEWQEGDTLAGIAGRFDAKLEDILTWPGNKLDLTEPKVDAGAWVMVPGGHREFRQWIIPTIPRGRAGVSVSLYGSGACVGGYTGANGSGAFIWPAGNHVLSGNDYWSGHLGIDIAAGEGAPVYAADSGVVVFAGWANGGYGNMVMIDHGNGYQSLYGHMSSVNASCGSSVGQGGIIGYSGSTGNSTGAHLHFEVRFQGGFVSPWYVLPAQ